MNITSEQIQRWVRIVLYYIFGAVGWSGVAAGIDLKSIIVSGVGFGLTALWTKYGSTVGAMLTEVEKTAGVEKVQVLVDPTKVDPIELDHATPAKVVVKPA